jgi:hypothetical protein
MISCANFSWFIFHFKIIIFYLIQWEFPRTIYNKCILLKTLFIIEIEIKIFNIVFDSIFKLNVIENIWTVEGIKKWLKDKMLNIFDRC